MAKTSSLQRLRSLIGQERSLALLIPEAERLREFNQRLVRTLPTAIGQACQVVAVVNGEARIECDSGAAASRLRSLATSTARALSAPASPVDRVRVRVRADWSRTERPEKPGLGQGALQAWNELDRELPSGALKEAVENLIRHHRHDR